MEPLPEKDLIQLAAKRGEAVQMELEQTHLIQADRTRTANPEPVSGEEGASARLSLESKAMSENQSETIPGRGAGRNLMQLSSMGEDSLGNTELGLGGSGI